MAAAGDVGHAAPDKTRRITPHPVSQADEVDAGTLCMLGRMEGLALSKLRRLVV